MKNNVGLLINNILSTVVNDFFPPVWVRLDALFPEVKGLLFKKSFECAFEAVEVSKGLAMQKVLQSSKKMVVRGR